LIAAAAALGLKLPVRTWAAVAPAAEWGTSDVELLTLIGDTILPATESSPGAASVEIGRFIAKMIDDCYTPETAPAVRGMLREMQEEAQRQFGRELAALTPAQREQIVADHERRALAKKDKAANAFRVLKELTLFGYFSSEPGATQALRYDPVPGAYHGSIPLRPEDRCWQS
jgi:hypothetical protein